MSDDMAKQIIAAIAALPPEEQAEGVHALVGNALKQMPIETIREIRAEIVAQFPEAIPIVTTTLDLIDGQLALRDIAPKEGWR